MAFEKIDKNSWKRKEYFEHYFTDVPCTYSMTIKLDITQIKKNGTKIVRCESCGILMRDNKYHNKKYCNDCKSPFRV